MARPNTSRARGEIRLEDLTTDQLDALADQLAPRLALRMLGALAPKASYYSTRVGHELPGYSVKASKALLPTIPGAVQRGRWWVLTREAFEAWERGQAPTPPTPRGPSAWDPADGLAEAGLRQRRRA